MIYFIQDSGTLHVKIGFALNSVDGRRATLQTGNSSPLVVLASMPGDRTREAELHRRFAEYRVAGEWFRPHPDVLALVLEVAASQRADESRAVSEPAGALPDLPRTIYLAGKITGRGETWRDKIVGRYSGEDCTWHGLSSRQRNGWAVTVGVVLGKHDLSGPYLSLTRDPGADYHSSELPVQSRQDHGTFHDPCSAACANSRFLDWGISPVVQKRADIARLCQEAIRRSDVVFAWVDGTDCHATFAEIGYAKALGKRVVLACPQAAPELWFLREMACVYIDGLDQPDEALLVGLGVLSGGEDAARDMVDQYDGCDVTILVGGLPPGEG